MRRPWATGLAGIVAGWAIFTGGLVPAGAAPPSLISSGNFEYPALKGAPSHQYETGQHVGAWDVTLGPVVVLPARVPYAVPPVGSQMMQLRGGLTRSDGEICQTVSNMTPRAAYVIRFQAGTALGASTLDVTLGGVALAHIDLTDTTFPAPFTLYELNVTAAAESAQLCLHGHPVSAIGFALVDAVRIKPGPPIQCGPCRRPRSTAR
jgi:hypothetical protein